MKKAIIVIIMLLTVLSCKKNNSELVEKIVEDLTIEQKIGQMLMFSIPGTGINSRTEKYMKLYKPGGIILFGHNITDSSQLKRFTTDLQHVSLLNSKIPLFISTDQEGGRIRRITDGVTQFPGNMALGVAADEDLTYSVGRVLGLQLRNLGVNMNLAPDVDINSNPDNPVINIRSFGSDKEVVALMGQRYIEGLQDSYCLAIAKHFPGHGDSEKDSHKTLPVINHSIDHLKQNDIYPFTKAIESNVAGIMTAHISYPKILKNDKPATLSKYFLTEILKEELLYNGLVITDDLEMGAIAQKKDIGEAAVESVKSGSDIILISTYNDSIKKIYDALLNAYKTGILSEERINESVTKIMLSKLDYRIMYIDEEQNELYEYSFENTDEDLIILKDAQKKNYAVTSKGLYYTGNDKFSLSDNELGVLSGDFKLKDFSVKNIEYVNKSSIQAYIRNHKENKIKVYYFLSNKNDKYYQVLKKITDENDNISLKIICNFNPYDISGYSDLPDTLFTFCDTQTSYWVVLNCIVGEIQPSKKINIDLGFGRFDKK